MQKLIFVSAHAGVSKKGNEYSMVRLSDGIDSFIVSKDVGVDVSQYHEGDEIMCDIHVSKGFGDTIKATLTAVE